MSEIKPQPPQPPKAQQQIKTYYEKYFDETYQRPYFYNPATGMSEWECPLNSIIVDMISQPTHSQASSGQSQQEQQPNQISESKSNTKVDKKKELEEKKREEYRQKQARLEELQRENLQIMYPDYFKQQQEIQQQNQTVQEAVEQDAADQEQAGKEDGDESDYVDVNDENDNLKDKEFQKEYKIFKQFRNIQTQEWMVRPARRQVKESKKETAYIEGNYDYNIWYDKYLTDRNQQVEKAPSLFKCNPQIDTGYTKADKFEKKGSTYFCVYFARGCCTEGVNCRFYHRTPQDEDLELANQDNLHDVFGRARHATHKEDHSGIGSFNKECRTLLITDIQIPTDSLTPQRDIVVNIYEQFSPWGEIEDIHFNNQKCLAYIKYRHRYFAEFAREAMLDQVLTEGSTEPITIRWGLDSPFDKSEALRAQQEVLEMQQRALNLAPITGKNKKKTQYLNPKSLQEQDPHQNLTLAQKLALKPSELVPQIANPSVKKREMKILEKERARDRQRELNSQRAEISEGFEANLFQSGAEISGSGYSVGQITDTSQLIENCNKMSSVLQKIEMNRSQNL